VSLEPPIVSVCVANSSTTWPALSGASTLGLSVLAAHQEDACQQLAAPDADRFAGLSWRHTPGGAVLLDGASAWLVCSPEHRIAAGDHELVLLRVQDLGADTDSAPLVFHASRYRRLAG
jgi:flavin reductase (DIM6/NTAB) family NADH-FMN oxidoreductase RutF